MAAGIYLCAEELELLAGLPALAQRLYVLGIRPQMCFKTGVVGRESRISWHGLARELRVESAPGIKEELPSKPQVRRACDHLVKVDLISMMSVDKQLMMKCLKARLTSDVQTKADNKPARETGTNPAGVDKPDSRVASGVGGDLDASLERLGDTIKQANPSHIGVSEKDQKNSLSARDSGKFAMYWDWKPFDGDRFAEACAMSEVCWDALSTEQKELIRVEFVRYWMAEGIANTQAIWEHRFIDSIGYQVQRGVGRLAQQGVVQ